MTDDAVLAAAIEARAHWQPTEAGAAAAVRWAETVRLA
jgi:hypothetical protein